MELLLILCLVQEPLRKRSEPGYYLRVRINYNHTFSQMLLNSCFFSRIGAM